MSKSLICVESHYKSKTFYLILSPEPPISLLYSLRKQSIDLFQPFFCIKSAILEGTGMQHTILPSSHTYTFILKITLSHTSYIKSKMNMITYLTWVSH